MAAVPPRRRPKAKPAAEPPVAKATKAPAKAIRKPSNTRKPKRQAPLVVNGMMLVSVHGAFASRALVDMPADLAKELFGQPLSSVLAPTHVIDATLGEIREIAKRDKPLAESALAASAVALAYEIQNPFNSATSKSMCARELRETMAKLNELAPAVPKKDALDELKARRATRRKSA